jgi:hypothetical protein
MVYSPFFATTRWDGYSCTIYVSVTQKDQLELLLMMDLIAIQDLQAGEELILAMDIDSISGVWVLSPDLLPAQWITTTQPT